MKYPVIHIHKVYFTKFQSVLHFWRLVTAEKSFFIAIPIQMKSTFTSPCYHLVFNFMSVPPCIFSILCFTQICVTQTYNICTQYASGFVFTICRFSVFPFMVPGQFTLPVRGPTLTHNHVDRSSSKVNFRTPYRRRRKQ